MPTPLPADIPAWRGEVAAALAATRAELAACDEDPGGEEFWHRMEDQAVLRARVERGLDVWGVEIPFRDQRDSGARTAGFRRRRRT